MTHTEPLAELNPFEFAFKALNQMFFGRKPHLAMESQRGRFLIKTASEPWEFDAVLKLRYQVFNREFKGAKIPFGWDFEGLDLVADHLIIIDQQPEPKVVATYRLLSSEFARRYYSQSEFTLSDFLSLPGSKLELGRACVHADYRRGLVMALLWQGLGEYAKLCGAQYMFGCSSLKTIDLRETFEVYRLLRTRQQLVEDLGIAPTNKYEMPLLKELVHFSRELFFEDTPVEQKQDVHSLLPTLLEGYLNAGAKVYGRPALDRDFNCVDFFTVLETKNLGRLYEKRFRL